jgi:hypothetical protein
MILSRRVSLGGIQLDEIHDAVVIRSVDPGVAHEDVNSVNRLGGFGQRMTGQHWETLEVSVTFAIDIPKTELEARGEVFDAVMAWAKKPGWLKTTTQPGRRMWAEKAVLPGRGDLRNWTADFTIVFRAYGVPFWQEETPAVLTVDSITSGTRAFEVKGLERTVANVTAKNISGQTIKDITITVGGNAFIFKNINLTASETLVITHTEDGLLKIRAEATSTSRSVYNLRTKESADDFYVEPGLVAVQVSSTRAVKLTVEAAGRWAS